MRPARAAILAPLLAALALAAPGARAGDNPLAPLTAVARHLDEGMAKFLGGTPAAEAFAPWKVAGSEDGGAALRRDLAKEGVATARSFFLEFELHYAKGDRWAYRVRASAWATAEDVVLVEVSAGEQDEAAPPRGAIPLDATGEALQAFAKAGKALDAALRTEEGARGVPLADPAALRKALGPDVPADRMEKDLAEAREALAKVPGALAALAPDRAVAVVDDQGFLAQDAEGHAVGGLNGEFEVGEDGTLTFALRRFRGMRRAKEEAQGQLARATLQRLVEALRMHRLAHGAWPASLAALAEKDAGTGEALLDEVPEDPWKRPFRYAVKGEGFEIRSLGPDGQEGTGDDVVVTGP